MVPNGAAQPCPLEAFGSKPRFAIHHQSGGDAGTTRVDGNEQLVKLILFQHAEAEWCASRADHPHLGQPA